MSSFWTIFKKEVYRVISDFRLVFMVFILPGLSIFVMYSIMGSVISGQMSAVEEHRIILYEENMPLAFRDLLLMEDEDGKPLLNIEIHSLNGLSEADIEQAMIAGDMDIVLSFEADFIEKIIQYAEPETDPPTLRIHYNYARQTSSFAYGKIWPYVEALSETYLQERLPDGDDIIFLRDTVPIIDERQITGQGMAMILPMLIVIFLFAGAMSIGPDAIAGEKERNTIATLLVTPTKRSGIALGKVMSLGVLSLASALSSFLGIVLSLPKLMQMDGGAGFDHYGVAEYGIILIILVTTVFFIVGLVAVISAYAKSIKEASMLIMPFYFITLIVGIVNSFGAEPNQAVWVHAIPIYGAVNLLSAVFTFDYMIWNVIVVGATSLVYTAVFIYVLSRMFNSEKIMFEK